MITVDEYYRMAATGLLAPDARVELLDGEIIDMSPIGSHHAACVRRLIAAFGGKLAKRAILCAQSPVRLNPFSEPEPDVALLRYRDDFYANGHPGAEDVLLLIEVADTSAPFDRNRKIPMYPKAGIPEIWLVDLNAAVIDVFIGETVRTARAGDTLAPQAFPDVVIEVSELLV